MREIKFHIRIKRINSQYIWDTYLTLDELLDRNGCLYNPQIEEIVFKREYTGLKDKNDKDIYEGDILEWHSHKNVTYNNEVYFCVGTATCGYKIKNGRYHKGLSFNGIFNTKAVIVGNIYENPELLKEQPLKKPQQNKI